MTLYENPNFKGRSKDFTDSCPNLLDGGFDSSTMFESSVKSIRGVWKLYSHPEYKGLIKVIEDGEDYKLVELLSIGISIIALPRPVSSLKLLRCSDFTEEPECTVYKDFYSGRSLTFRDDIQNLKWYDFTDKMSSIVVKSGAWVGYTEPDYEGYQSLFLKGSYKFSDKPHDEGGFGNDQMSSFSKIVMKPAGQMKVLSINYDLDKKNILRSPRLSSAELSPSYTYAKQVKIYIITATMTADVGIPLVGGTEVSISAEISASIGSTSGTKTSKTEKWVAEYPSKIPPYSTVTVTSKLIEGKFNMPFTAILCYGDDTEHTVTEKGVFYGCQYFDFHTEFNETKLPKPT
ncbi:CRYB [Mytilus coruscus]|uniref:CRYB n=1 Tax=Mytilus coruscus TaxID=42192 RepID=A0A6J8ESM6_MYTCO|nr:CRYB [Mytilus coruscus]